MGKLSFSSTTLKKWKVFTILKLISFFRDAINSKLFIQNPPILAAIHSAKLLSTSSICFIFNKQRGKAEKVHAFLPMSIGIYIHLVITCTVMLSSPSKTLAEFMLISIYFVSVIVASSVSTENNAAATVTESRIILENEVRYNIL